MLAAQRRVEILQAVEAAGTLTTDELAQRLRVSGETIRRDLLLLDRERLVRRVHGGAMATPQMRREEPPYSVRAADSAAKHRIGQLAASLVNPGRTVVFDVGTTVLAAARALPANFSGVAVTCSLVAAAELAPPEVQVLIAGGHVRPGDLAVSNAHTVAFFEEIHADVVFLGLGCVSSDEGLTDFYVDEIATRQSSSPTPRPPTFSPTPADSARWLPTVSVVLKRSQHSSPTRPRQNRWRPHFPLPAGASSIPRRPHVWLAPGSDLIPASHVEARIEQRQRRRAVMPCAALDATGPEGSSMPRRGSNISRTGPSHCRQLACASCPCSTRRITADASQASDCAESEHVAGECLRHLGGMRRGRSLWRQEDHARKASRAIAMPLSGRRLEGLADDCDGSRAGI